jgi:hypothetical protein
VKSLLSVINVIVAVTAGLIVLLGYFLPGIFGGVRALFVQWAVILAGFALLVGIINLFRVHLKKARASPAQGVNSIVLILTLLATMIIVGWNGPTGEWALWIFNTFQVPVEISLLAILAVVLAYAAVRLLRRKVDRFSLIFLLTFLLVILGTTPMIFFEEFDLLQTIRTWIAQVPALAGARGLLLGIALGTIATGLRVLLGADRPYGE